MSPDLSKTIIWFTMADLVRITNLKPNSLGSYHSKGKLYKMTFQQVKTAVPDPLYGMPLLTFVEVAFTPEGTIHRNKFFLDPQALDVTHLIPESHDRWGQMQEVARVPYTGGMAHVPVLTSDLLHVTRFASFEVAKIKRFSSQLPSRYVDKNLRILSLHSDGHLFESNDGFEPQDMSSEEVPAAFRDFLKRVILASSIDDLREEAYEILHPNA